MSIIQSVCTKMFEIVELCSFDMSACFRLSCFGILRCWSFWPSETLKLCASWKLWNSDVLKIRIFLLIWQALEKTDREIMKILLDRFWKFWIWDQCLPDNMKRAFSSLGILETTKLRKNQKPINFSSKGIAGSTSYL